MASPLFDLLFGGEQREQEQAFRREQMERIRRKEELSEGLQAIQTLGQILSLPKAQRSAPMKLAGQVFGTKYGMDMETLSKTATQLDDETAKSLATMLQESFKGAKTDEEIQAALQQAMQVMQPGAALQYIVKGAQEAAKKAEEAEKNKIIGKPLSQTPGTAVPQGWQPKTPQDSLAVLQQQEQEFQEIVRQLGERGGPNEAQQRALAMRQGFLQRERERLSPKAPTSEVGLAYGAAGGDEQATRAMGLLREGKTDTYANEAERIAGELFDAPFARLTKEQRRVVNRQVQANKLALSERQGLEAAERALDKPLSVADARALQVPVGTTLRDVRGKGMVPQTTAQQATAESVKSVNVILDRLDVLADKAFRADGMLGRLLRAPRTNLGIMLQTDEDAVLYQSLTMGTLAPMIRALGEKGTLANEDVARAIELMPKLTPVPDTRSVALGKLRQLRNMFREIAKRPGAGSAPAEKATEGDDVDAARKRLGLD